MNQDFFLLLLSYYLRKRCYCGSLYGNFGSNETDCTVSCEGNSTQICGGTLFNAISLFGSNKSDLSTFKVYLGCKRFLNNQFPFILLSNQTGSACVDFCSQNDSYPLSGVASSK